MGPNGYCRCIDPLATLDADGRCVCPDGRSPGVGGVLGDYGGAYYDFYASSPGVGCEPPGLYSSGYPSFVRFRLRARSGGGSAGFAAGDSEVTLGTLLFAPNRQVSWAADIPASADAATPAPSPSGVAIPAAPTPSPIDAAGGILPPMAAVPVSSGDELADEPLNSSRAADGTPSEAPSVPSAAPAPASDFAIAGSAVSPRVGVVALSEPTPPLPATEPLLGDEAQGAATLVAYFPAARAWCALAQQQSRSPDAQRSGAAGAGLPREQHGPAVACQGECVRDYQQCAGRGMDAQPRPCCDPRSTCLVKNEWCDNPAPRVLHMTVHESSSL